MDKDIQYYFLNYNWKTMDTTYISTNGGGDVTDGG